MPIKYVVDRVERKLRTTVQGPITADDILGHLDHVQKDDALPYSELIDVSGAERPYMSPAEIWRAATAVEAKHLEGPLGPRAVVAKDDLLFGLVRIFTNLMTGYFPIQVFRSLEAAEDWIAEQRGKYGAA